jgi:hypothetical protein
LKILIVAPEDVFSKAANKLLINESLPTIEPCTNNTPSVCPIKLLIPVLLQASATLVALDDVLFIYDVA